MCPLHWTGHSVRTETLSALPPAVYLVHAGNFFLSVGKMTVQVTAQARTGACVQQGVRPIWGWLESNPLGSRTCRWLFKVISTINTDSSSRDRKQLPFGNQFDASLSHQSHEPRASQVPPGGFPGLLNIGLETHTPPSTILPEQLPVSLVFLFPFLLYFS